MLFSVVRNFMKTVVITLIIITKRQTEPRTFYGEIIDGMKTRSNTAGVVFLARTDIKALTTVTA